MKRKAVSIILLVLTAAVCGSCRSLVPGTFRETLMVERAARTCLIHLPPAFDRKTALPLVVALHPFTGTGSAMERLTGFSALADAQQFIVAYPDARQRVWNANPAAPSAIVGTPANDVAFISSLIDYMVDSYGADPDRVYVAGASSGGLMTHRVACDLTEKLAGVATVMITLPVGWQALEVPARPLPIIMVQGTEDPFFPWDGGTVEEGPFRRTEYQSMADTVGFWVDNNNAYTPPNTEQLADIEPTDGTRVTRETYSSDAAGADVTLYRVDGGGHTWPGHALPVLKPLLGRTSRDIDATAVIWDFLKTHTRSNQKAETTPP